ncbi:MAG: hypothetical protein DRP82_06435, partial [Planctomycetota bacterium]
MNNQKKVFEVAILARVKWNLHSLNNEGTLGNVTEPRTVVLADGAKTDGISGEMLKHIHFEYLWQIAQGAPNPTFCVACKQKSPFKADKAIILEKPDRTKDVFNINYLTEGQKEQNIKGQEVPEKIIKASLACVVCDLHGFMLAQQGVAISRPSTLEFGWAVAIPQETDQGRRVYDTKALHLHARHVQGAERTQESQTGQMVYHRPTRSGVYAFVSVFQPWRISLNEVVYKYVNDIDERKKRMELALEAYKALFMRTDGAMTTTRLPHTEGIEGVVVVSRKPFPAPVISPLKDGYEQEIRSICNSNGLEPKPFGGLEEFCALMDELKNEKP